MDAQTLDTIRASFAGTASARALGVLMGTSSNLHPDAAHGMWESAARLYSADESDGQSPEWLAFVSGWSEGVSASRGDFRPCVWTFDGAELDALRARIADAHTAVRVSADHGRLKVKCDEGMWSAGTFRNGPDER